MPASETASKANTSSAPSIETKPTTMQAGVSAEEASGETSVCRVTLPEMYREGSECCRNYSRLTMQVRTLAGYIMVAYAVGIGTLGSHWLSVASTPIAPGLRSVLRSMPPQTPLVLWFGGAVLLLFSISLWTVNWHFSTAFKAMRDVLRDMELKAGFAGPWRAHKTVRGQWQDKVAWNLPFVLLSLIAIASLWGGHLARP